MVSAHLEISGKVQGVFFRATAKKVAEENKVTGWIRNMENGNVEVFATGYKEDVERFIDWCKHGPPNAKVFDITITYIEETTFKEFKVKRD